MRHSTDEHQCQGQRSTAARVHKDTPPSISRTILSDLQQNVKFSSSIARCDLKVPLQGTAGWPAVLQIWLIIRLVP